MMHLGMNIFEFNSWKTIFKKILKKKNLRSMFENLKDFYHVFYVFKYSLKKLLYVIF